MMLAVAASQQSEVDALLESGWWDGSVISVAHHCSWPGVTCNDNLSVIEISISPTIYLFDRKSFAKLNFSALPNLLRLDISKQGVYGCIPPGLGRLTKLRSLSLGANQLNGSIPPKIGKLHNLVTLDLSYNSLLGEVPSALGQLANLVTLNLSDNSLSGEVPSALGQLANLVTLDLSGAYLSGEVPSTLGQLANLVTLDLSGSIPPALLRLTNLTYLYLDSNLLQEEYIELKVGKHIQVQQKMGIYSQYGTLMEGLHMKMSLKQLRILTSNIALALVGMVVFIEHNCQVVK
ncbi:hypothetical protein SLEP1_g10303 [Rubroshorea leprosula]|uniref:Disease resistance R13L4/SHOC-2-like LRR domain-containing protein n=1 Tax=Rubroshorea leprosula TaxID=152421 RepID=A0AAV5IGZ5_9ROSI|nr:hypothetical protein SLEP1_g10303 [Rubroshorea leprosula]